MIAGEPEYAAAGCGVVVVASAASGTVTILDQPSMRTIRVIHGFVSPHIPALAPGCDDAYVTDDATGVLTAIDLNTDRVASRTAVGGGAHHLALGTDALHIWVALGQAAPTVAMLSTIVATPPRPSSPVQDAGHPHVTADWRPPFLVHDLLYSPDGRRVWVTSADTTYVGVFDARSRRLLFRVPAGAPPQHVVFAGASAYITSGYGSMIERVSLATGRVLARARAPYGSFDLDAGGGYVVAASLFEGTIAVYDWRLRPLRVRRLATSAEDVSISPPSSAKAAASIDVTWPTPCGAAAAPPPACRAAAARRRPTASPARRTRRNRAPSR